jgi:hypothetical protein
MLSDEWQLKSRVCLTHTAQNTQGRKVQKSIMHAAAFLVLVEYLVSFALICAIHLGNDVTYSLIAASQLAELTQIMLFKSIGEARSHFAPFTIPESCNHASFEFPNKTKYNHCGVDNKFARERLLKSSKS